MVIEEFSPVSVVSGFVLGKIFALSLLTTSVNVLISSVQALECLSFQFFGKKRKVASRKFIQRAVRAQAIVLKRIAIPWAEKSHVVYDYIEVHKNYFSSDSTSFLDPISPFPILLRIKISFKKASYVLHW